MSGLCRWAHESGYSPVEIKVKRFPDKLTRAPLPVIPPQEDIEKLLAVIPWPKKGIFYCMYYGGLRKGEAVSLKAESIDLARGSMTVRGKGNKQRVIPILEYLKQILERRLQEVSTGLLWAAPSGGEMYDLRMTLKWGLKRAGVKSNITPHSLRHAFGVRAAMAGVHLRAIQIILGHSTSKVTEIYTQLAQSQIFDEMKKF